MAKKIPAVTQAFIDLMHVQTELKLAEAHGAVKSERAKELAARLEAATDVLQRSINRAKRVLENGIEDED
jgi:hypothetical protein